MDNLTILDALRTNGVRLSNGDKWLIVDDDGMFVVCRRKYNARKTSVVIRTNDECAAVAVLLEE